MKIGYARESTKLESQDQALAHQIDRLKSYGADQILVDRESGGKDDRQGFVQVLELVKSGIATEVVVTHLTRLGRSVVGIQKVIEAISKAKVTLTVLDGQVDLRTAAGRAFVSSQAVWAQYERELISERITNGWAYVRKLQKAVNPPFAYVVADDRYQLDRSLLEAGCSRAQVGREIVETFLRVRSLRRAVREICLRYPDLLGIQGAIKGVPRSNAGLKDWLLNPVLLGHTRYKKRKEPIFCYDTHPGDRLLSDEEAYQIREILSFNRFHHGFHTDAPKFPLTGLIKCGWCGSSTELIGVANRTTGERYYQCQKYAIGQCLIKPVQRGQKTLRTSIRTSVVERAAIEALTAKAGVIAQDLSQPEEAIDPPELLELKSRLQALEQIPGSDPYIEQAKRGIELEIQNRTALQALPSVDGEIRYKMLEALSRPDFWMQIRPEEKGEFYRMLIKRVVIQGDRIISIELWV